MSAQQTLNDLRQGIAEAEDKIIVPGLPSVGAIIGWGKAKPTDGTAGFAPGALFIDYVAGKQYRNNSTALSCAFVEQTT
jgi:hypothetical protein